MTMGFQQLYYTSCEHGLLGYGGFQFNAVTAGVPPAVMREVEQLTSYEPPRTMPGDPEPDELAGYPVMFFHIPGNGQASITAQVVFAGTDYSGRPGNYFAHALVASSAADFGPMLPAELWDAPLWRIKPVDVRELLPLPSPPPRGPLNRAAVQEFVSHADPAVLPVLLTAAGQAMDGGRPLLLAGPDTASNARWIAAICYLLGDELARQLSFTTYSHRPAYSSHQVIGVLSGSAPDDESFRVYDSVTGRLPRLEPHPLAELLSRAGLAEAAALWRQAATLTAPSPTTLDDWYPAVAAAAMTSAIPVAPGDIAAAAGWLGTARQPAASTVLDALIEHKDVSLSPAQAADLHAVAVRLGGGSAAGRLELELVDGAYTLLSRGEAPGVQIQLTTPSAREEARGWCVATLDRCPPERAPAVLEWTARAGVTLEPRELHKFGVSLNPAMDAGLLRTILAGQPDIVAGLVTRLSASPQEARELFRRANVLDHKDVRDHPQLSEQWVLAACARGDLPAIDALQAIGKIRRGQRGPGPGVLDELWPAECTDEELGQLLPLLAEPSQQDWLARRVGAALAAGSGHDRAALAKAVAGYPAIRDRLPADARKTAEALSKAGALLDGARVRVRRGDTRVFRELYTAYRSADQRAKGLLGRKIPELLCEATPLSAAIRGCPEPLWRTFCAELRMRLNPLRADAPALAAEVFLAITDLGNRGDTGPARDLTAEFRAVLKWPASRRRALRKALGRNAEAFDQWREINHRGPLSMFRGLLGKR